MCIARAGNDNLTMASQLTDQATAQEWRDLGFYYERDDEMKAWKLSGSRKGLSRFSNALRTYVADPRNAMNAEHEHYGPYMYLEVMTWPEAGFDKHAIRGPLEDLLRLADLIDTALNGALPRSSIVIREEFVESSPYSLVLELQPDGFDPAQADPQLRNGTEFTGNSPR